MGTTGVIARCMFVNYPVVRKLLPGDFGVVGICFFRLEKMRPLGLPWPCRIIYFRLPLAVRAETNSIVFSTYAAKRVRSS